MCGICGIALSSRSPQVVDRGALVRMRDVMTHRGPDGAGLFIDAGIGLGHRRLSIIDVAGGAQPMASEDGRFQIVYNGEVYNHPVLRAELEARGVHYRTRCDTETVLHLYEAERALAPRRLRGMFAFAIWDRRGRELFLARDRFGVKPLYYACTEDGSLVFASEIKAILASGLVRPLLNDAALPDYLANHAPSGEETMFQGIRRLPAGHTLSWRNGAVRIEPYWDLSFAGAGELAGTGERDLVAEYAERFREAVRMRLMADVPLGMFLSGGIDSASITAVMSQLVDEPIKTFSVAFAEREANELAYARLVADRYRTDHHEIVVTPAEFWGALPRLLWHEDEPIAHPSSIALNFVSRLAAEHVKVVLTGEGSDETLAGYNRYRVTLYNLALGAWYRRLTTGGMRAIARRGVEAMPGRSRLRRIMERTFLSVPPDIDSLYFDNFAVFSRAHQQRLLTPALRERVGTAEPYAAAHRALEHFDGHPDDLLNRILYCDTKTYLHELLMKQDQMSMAASIESRVPFLDHPLVEFLVRLPPNLKLRGTTTKYILRRSMRDALPAEVLSRRKMGFPVPIGAWLRREFRPVLDEYVLGERAARRGLFDPRYVWEIVERHLGGEDHSQRLWALINLEIWQRLFLDGETLADLEGITSPTDTAAAAC